MVHILLLILKIIGIILLAILAVCLLILFFPITYIVKGNFDEKNYHVCIRCGWLFHLIHFGGKFSNEEKKAKIRILGIPINLLKEKTESKKKKSRKMENKTFTNKKADAESVSHAEKKDVNILESTEKQTDQNKINENKYQKNDIENKIFENQNINEKEKNGFIDKVKCFFRMICDFIKKVENTVSNALKNVKGAYNKAKEIKAFITANATKRAYRYGKGIINKIVKHIFPKKIEAKIDFGFESPDVTGKVLGYIAIIFGTFHINTKRISINPDFDKKVIKGNIKIKGHFIICILLIYILKFYFKKEIHDIIKKFS